MGAVSELQDGCGDLETVTRLGSERDLEDEPRGAVNQWLPEETKRTDKPVTSGNDLAHHNRAQGGQVQMLLSDAQDRCHGGFSRWNELWARRQDRRQLPVVTHAEPFQYFRGLVTQEEPFQTLTGFVTQAEPFQTLALPPGFGRRIMVAAAQALEVEVLETVKLPGFSAAPEATLFR